MPLEQTITIVNNSGKIISTGKQLFSIFKEAKASYQDKKAEIRGLKRAETFDQSRSTSRREVYRPDHITEYDYGQNPDYHGSRRRSYDAHSEAGSHRSRHSKSHHSHSKYERHHGAKSRPALTERNLKTLSEKSGVSPSRAPPNSYRSPYAETLPRDMAMSGLDLPRTQMRTVTPTDIARPGRIPRSRSESQLAVRQPLHVKEIDMNLAYGEIPPDLEYRVDLDPTRQADYDEKRANMLVRKVEGLLDEAKCLQHSAGATIKHLQQKPDAAAAVALTLAELSTVVSKMSPAFISFLKGGSPAVFSLLASPQFLIGTGIAVGVTVVMFGGWKIVKRIKEEQAAREAMAFQGVPFNRPAPLRTQTAYSAGIDEALVLDEELSTIESWRRGIMPAGADAESADIELITPEADRSHRHRHRRDDSDARSHRSTRTSKTSRTAKTEKTTKTGKTGKTSKTHHTQKSSAKGKERETPERRNSHHATVESVAGDTELGVKHSRKGKEKEKPSGRRPPLLLEDGRSKRGQSSLDMVLRPKSERQSENMLKALFKNKERKEQGSRSELVLA